MPVIAKCHDDRYIIIMGRSDSGWKILNPEEKQPVNVSDEEIDDMITGDIIVIGRKSNSDAGIENNGKNSDSAGLFPRF